MLPHVAFNIDTADIIELAKGISRYNIRESVGFPKDLKDQTMGGKGACVIPTTLESNVVWLHSILFADENYSVSDAVKRYSQKISEDSAEYANRKKADESADQKSTKSSEDETEKKVQNTAESKKDDSSIKKPKTDKDGYLIKGTDADGKYIYETDADGNKLKADAETSKAGETRESETDEGEIIEEPTKETAEGGTRESETDEGEIIEASTRERAETSKGETSESMAATVEEPGKLPDADADGYDGPA